MKTIYLVEDCGDSPGRIYAIFAHAEDAHLFAKAIEQDCAVVERTVHYGQPSFWGYNK